MFVEKRQYDDGSIIGLWQMTESADELLRLLNDPTFEAEIKSFSAEKRKCEKLAARLLLKTILGKSVKVIYSENGAPALSDSSHYISISHCKNFVAVILHPTCRVGIDIEQVNPRVEKLKEKFLSENELKQISENQQIEQLLVYWCAKETLFKLLEENEIHFSQQLHIAPFSLQEKDSLSAYETRTERKQHFTLNYEITADYVMVWGKV